MLPLLKLDPAEVQMIIALAGVDIIQMIQRRK